MTAALLEQLADPKYTTTHYEPAITQPNHILLDMDGVLVDFTGGVADLFGHDIDDLQDWGLWDALGITKDEFWRTINNQGHEWWANLKPYPWAHELWDFLHTIAPVTVCTTPCRGLECPQGKLQWLYREFGYPNDNWLMGKQKHLLAGPGRLLIDDYDPNCSAFREFMGQAIVFPRPWNSSHVFSDDPFTHVLAHIDSYYPTLL